MTQAQELEAQKKPSLLGNVAVLVLSLLIAFSLGEILVRKAGFRPWTPGKNPIQIDPGGKLATQNPILGYTLLPGQFKATLSSGYSFIMTHLSNTLRITHPIETYASVRPENEMWIFGCSFTYGWALNDQDTYPWLVQKHLPDYEVVNFGVIGYDTLNALIQFQEALKRGKKPKVVVYAYASFHDERNTFLRKRRKAVGPANELGPMNQPYARLDGEGKLKIKTALAAYEGLPLIRYSALMNFLDNKLNDQEDRFVHSDAVTKQLIEQFAHLAEEKGIKFVVAGIDSDSVRMLRNLNREGIKTVDISVDLSGQENRSWPYDSHPNAKANQQYAEHLIRYLKTSGLV